MSLLDRLANAHIESAIERGEFDDLPGAGSPLPADEARDVPAHLRAGYRMLKNAGYVPPEIEAHRQLRKVDDLLAHALPDSREDRELTRRVRWLELRLAESSRGRALLRDRGYGERIRERLSSRAPAP